MKSPVDLPEGIIKTSEHSPAIGLRNNFYNMYIENTENILGKILTVIDASFPDHEQRKAVKDLVKAAYYDNRLRLYDFGEIVYSFCQQYCSCGTENTGSSRDVMKPKDENDLLGIVECEAHEEPKFDFVH